jgi:hypothetical protein
VSEGFSPEPANSALATATVAAETASRALGGLRENFEEAAEQDGGFVEHRFTIAGYSVSLRFASRVAADLLTRAFAHLDASDDPPTLTLYAWDAATTSTGRPAFAPPQKADGVAPGAGATGPGVSYHYDHTEFHALYQPGPDVLAVLSARAEVGWFWTADIRRLPHWEYAAPFRHLLSWWLDARGCQLVHGGSVGTPAGGVLLVGRGGLGKSTTALATLRDPRLRYAGDDYVALRGGASPFVHSLYCSAKIHASDLARVPHVRSAVANVDRLADEKAVLFVPRAFPDASITGFPLRAILIPRVTARRSARLLDATHADALSVLAPSTVLQRRPPRRESLSELARLVEQVPAYVLEVGSDLSTIPDAILEAMS